MRVLFAIAACVLALCWPADALGQSTGGSFGGGSFGGGSSGSGSSGTRSSGSRSSGSHGWSSGRSHDSSESEGGGIIGWLLSPPEKSAPSRPAGSGPYWQHRERHGQPDEERHRSPAATLNPAFGGMLACGWGIAALIGLGAALSLKTKKPS